MSDVRTWLLENGFGQYAEAIEISDIEMGRLKSSAALVMHVMCPASDVHDRCPTSNFRGDAACLIQNTDYLGLF